MGLPDLLGALRERDFRLQFCAQATSLIGDNIVPVALAFAVLDLTGSASDLGIVLAARTLPLVVFVLAGGVWADRLPRHVLMLSSDLGRAVSQGVLAALLITGRATVWEIVVLQAVNGTATAFFRPASTGLTPHTVSAERLQQANALLYFTLSIASIVGPALAGVLVATIGSGWAIAVDAATFAVSAAFLLQLRVPPRIVAARESFFAELAGGWREVRSRTWLWVCIVDFAFFQILFLSTFFVLGPEISKHSLGGAGAWALIVSAMGVGSVLGSLLGLRYHPARPLFVAHLVILGVAPSLLLLGLRAPAILVAIATVPTGLAMQFANTVYETAMQQHVPDQALSRVAAYDWMGSTVLRPIGYVVVGPLAAVIGNRATLLGSAALMVGAELATLMVPSVRNLPRRPRADELLPEPPVTPAAAVEPVE